jgi:hypothetical protein
MSLVLTNPVLPLTTTGPFPGKAYECLGFLPGMTIFLKYMERTVEGLIVEPVPPEDPSEVTFYPTTGFYSDRSIYIKHIVDSDPSYPLPYIASWTSGGFLSHWVEVTEIAIPTRPWLQFQFALTKPEVAKLNICGGKDGCCVVCHETLSPWGGGMGWFCRKCEP